MYFYELSNSFNYLLNNYLQSSSTTDKDLIEHINFIKNAINFNIELLNTKINYKSYDFSPQTKIASYLNNNIKKAINTHTVNNTYTSDNKVINNTYNKYYIQTNKNSKELNRKDIILSVINSQVSYINYNVDCIDIQTKKLILEAKNKINYNKKIWDKVKTITNDYEFVCINTCKLFDYTASFKNKYIGTLKLKYNNNNVYVNTSNLQVSKLNTLSRSFYKMIEMLNVFLKDEINLYSIRTLHLAEGPGGFIEALCYVRNEILESRNSENNDIYFGMTLLEDTDTNIPSWKKSVEFLKNNHKNVKIITGVDNTGNLFNVENIKHLFYRFKNNKCDFITGDGGFDFSDDVKNQEIMASKLIWSQFISGIACLKINGTFILKIFDINNKLTSDILFISYLLFKKICIYKPKTSRLANSEKYIVCMGFKGCSDDVIMNFINLLDEWNNSDACNNLLCNLLLESKLTNKKTVINNYNYKQINKLHFDEKLQSIVEIFYTFIRELNKHIITNQLNNINNTLYYCNLLKNKKLYFRTINDRLCKQKLNAIEWCKVNNIPYYN